MARRRKAVLLALLATVLGVTMVSPAQAALFTNPNGGSTVLTLGSDGIGKSSHHVFDLGGGTVTCGDAITTGGGQTVSSTSFTYVTAIPSYHFCNFLGQNTSVNMNGCEYRFNASGTLEIRNAVFFEIVGGITIEILKNCELEPITFEIPGCHVTIGPQTLSGITYSNVVSGGGVSQITMSISAKSIKGSAVGAACPKPGAFTNGEYTTGNTIIHGEVDPGLTPKPVSFDP